MNSKDIAQRIAEAIEAVDPTIDDPRAIDARFDAFMAREAATAPAPGPVIAGAAQRSRASHRGHVG